MTLLLDTNVLVSAFRKDSGHFDRLHPWLEALASSNTPFALADLVLSGFLRVVTHPRVFARPSTFSEALEFAEALRNAPRAISVSPGPRHWEIFTDLCARTRARGNTIPDAFLAALAIEWGFELVTSDRGFAQFPGLRWREPEE